MNELDLLVLRTMAMRVGGLEAETGQLRAMLQAARDELVEMAKKLPPEPDPADRPEDRPSPTEDEKKS